MNLQQPYAKSYDSNLYQRDSNINLRGLNTQFRNANLFDNNKNLFNPETLKKYCVIKNPGLEYKYINRPYKLILKTSNYIQTHTFTFDQPFKDVTSVKLLKAYSSGLISSKSTGILEDVEFLVLHIDELKKNYGDNSSNKLKNSFAILDLDKVAAPNTSGNNLNFYENTFSTNQDIMYFDPPLNCLNKLTCSIYFDNGTSSNTPAGLPIELKLELLINTKDKLRAY